MSRLKLFWQLESTDCGPACLQMLCAFYGKNVSQQYIKDGLSMSRVGLTIRDLMQRSSELGFNYVVAKAKPHQLNKISAPIILHWHNNHFVVLYKIKKRGKGGNAYFVADPSNGKIKFTQEEFEHNWCKNGSETGIFILLKPTNKFYKKEFPRQKTDWLLAKHFLKKYHPSHKKILFSILLMCVSMICNWMVPLIYQESIDNGVIFKNEPLILKLLCIQLSFFFGYTISSSLSSYLISKINLYVGVEYVGELLDKIMRLPIKHFDTRLNTEFIQRLDDFARIRTFLVDNVISIFYYLVNAIVYFVLLAYYNWCTLIIFIIISIIVFAWDWHFIHERRFLDYSLFAENARNRNLLYEIINFMPDIKVNNAQETEKKRWERNQEHINELMLQQIKLNYKQNVGRTTINKLRDILIIGFCCILSIQENISLGVLMSISYILGQLGGPIDQIQSFVTQYQMFKNSLTRLSEVQRKENEMDSNKKNIKLLKKGISIKDVTFKYEGSFSPYVFEGLSVCFPSNKMTAIVGSSGSGKSTLIKLILGFTSVHENLLTNPLFQ